MYPSKTGQAKSNWMRWREFRRIPTLAGAMPARKSRLDRLFRDKSLSLTRGFATRAGNIAGGFPLHRCDLARAWLTRYSFPASYSRRALVCKGVRHALALIFQKLALCDATLWIPSDVYPVYQELAHTAGLKPQLFSTLPEPKIPASKSNVDPEYLLIANPLKPLGRYLTENECASLTQWLEASPRRRLFLDCVYDLNAPFHTTTQGLQNTGQTILLHSVTKGWLWPRTFGVAFINEDDSQFENAFRNAPPTPDQLRLARHFFSTASNCPEQVTAVLRTRAKKLLAVLPESVCKLLLIDPADHAPGCYFFPTRIPAGELLREYRLLAVPSSTFGAKWGGASSPACRRHSPRRRESAQILKGVYHFTIGLSMHVVLQKRDAPDFLKAMKKDPGSLYQWERDGDKIRGGVRVF